MHRRSCVVSSVACCTILRYLSVANIWVGQYRSQFICTFTLFPLMRSGFVAKLSKVCNYPSLEAAHGQPRIIHESLRRRVSLKSIIVVSPYSSKDLPSTFSV
jgi:hypothetical protein